MQLSIELNLIASSLSFRGLTTTEDERKNQIKTLSYIYKTCQESLLRSWKKSYESTFEEEITKLYGIEEYGIQNFIKKNPKIQYKKDHALNLDFWHQIADGESTVSSYEVDSKTFFYYNGSKLTILDGYIYGDFNSRNEGVKQFKILYETIFEPQQFIKYRKEFSDFGKKLFKIEKKRDYNSSLSEDISFLLEIEKKVRKRIWVYRMFREFSTSLFQIQSEFFLNTYLKLPNQGLRASSREVEREKAKREYDIERKEVEERLKGAKEALDKEFNRQHLDDAGIERALKERNKYQSELERLDKKFKHKWHLDESYDAFKKEVKDWKGWSGAAAKKGGEMITCRIAEGLGELIFKGKTKKLKGENLKEFFLTKILPGMIGAGLDFFTGGFGSKVVDSFMKGALSKPDPVIEKLDEFMDKFDEFKRDVMKKFDEVLEDTQTLKKNVEKILKKLEESGIEMKEILDFTNKRFFLEIEMEKLKSKIYSTLNEIITNRDDVHQVANKHYSIANTYLIEYKNYLLDIYQVAYNLLGTLPDINDTSRRTFTEKFQVFINTPKALEGSHIFEAKRKAQEDNSLFSVQEIMEYSENLANNINSVTNIVCTTAERIADFLAISYQYPSQFGDAEQIQRAIFKDINFFRQNRIAGNDTEIGPDDTALFTQNIISPSFDAVSFQSNTFGFDLNQLYLDLKSSSIYHIILKDKILQVADYQKEVGTLDEPLEKFYLKNNYEDMGGEYKGYSYKWRIIWVNNGNGITIQLIRGNELQYLSNTSSGKLVLTSIDKPEISDNVLWRIEQVKKSDDGIIILNLINKDTGKKLTEVYFRYFHASQDVITRKNYLNIIANYKEEDEITENSKRQALHEAITRKKVWNKWNSIVHGIAYFESQYNPILRKGVLYKAVNGGIATPPYLIVEDNALVIYKWENEKDTEIQKILICKGKDFDILRYERVDSYGIYDTNYKKGGLFAYKEDKEGKLSLNGKKYVRVPCEILKQISGGYSVGMVLFLDKSGKLKIANKYGKLVWISKLSRRHYQRMITNFSVDYTELIQVRNSRGNYKQGKKFTEWFNKKNENRDKYLAPFRPDLNCDTFPYPLTGGKIVYRIYLNGHSYSLVGADKLVINTTSFIDQTDYTDDIFRQKPITQLYVARSIDYLANELKLYTQEEKNKWVKFDADLNKENGHDVFIFIKRSNFSTNYTDIIYYIYIDEAFKKEDLKSKNNTLPLGYIAIDKEINDNNKSTEKGGGSYIRICYRKLTNDAMNVE